MKSYTLYLLALAVLLLLSGCHTDQAGDNALYYTARSFKTKDQVLKNLGGPMVVTKKGEDEALTYAYKRAEGKGFGVGWWGIGPFASSSHKASDIVTFLIDPDGRVKKHQMGVHATHTLENGFWPFGEKE